MSKISIKWMDRGRPPRQPSNPFYPDGCDIDLSGSEPKLRHPAGLEADETGCVVELPYPPPHVNIGGWLITCQTCGSNALITAASRPDDPRVVKLPCKVAGLEPPSHPAA